MQTYLEFEKPVAEIDALIVEKRNDTSLSGTKLVDEINRLERKRAKELEELYENLCPVDKIQVARHAERPHALDYINGLISDFTPLAGDRTFGEDEAIIGGIGRFYGVSCVVIGQEKGHDTETRMRHNFGMPHPEGYRKAIRLMELADQFGLPVITLVDTNGAYPGLGSEERGIAEAIAKSIQTCLRIKSPLISAIIGEGGSGGAIALAVADKVLMLEHAIYSVITPEGCASILWRDAAKSGEAAKALKITAQDLMSLNLIDQIVKEPLGGAHRNKEKMIKDLGRVIETELRQIKSLEGTKRRADRAEKFLNMGR